MLIGRTAECARIDRLLTEARKGHGTALVVRGPAGIGKSALLEYACSRAADMRVVSAAGVESETELPFAGLMSLLRPLLEHREALVEVQRQALDKALALQGGGAPDRFGIGIATLSMLVAAAERRPLLVVVDDAQWIDAPSRDALLFAARRIRGDPVAMLLASREEERALDPQGLDELELGGLQAGDCRRLIIEVLGPRATARTVERLTRATGGNPLALLELPTRDGHELLPVDEVVDRPLPVGPRIRGAFSRRIAQLPTASQRALGLAAVSETGAMAEIGAVLQRLGLDSSALAPAEATGLVTVEAAHLRYRHPLLRSVAYHALSPPERRLGHLALAEALHADPTSTRRAWHLAAAVVQPDEQTASELESAAREAHDRAAPAAAAAALEAAARLTPQAQTRVRRLMEAAGELHLAGRGEEAAHLLDDAFASTEDRLARAELVHLRSRVQLLDAPCVRNRVRLVAEAERVADLDPQRTVAMLIDGSLLATMAGEPREALALAERAGSLLDEREPALALAGAHARGMGLLLCGRGHEAARELVRARPLASTPDLIGSGHLAVSVAQCETWRGDPLTARQLLKALIQRARAQSVLTVLPYALAALAEAETHLGDWAAAYADASESVSLAEEFSQSTELAHSLARLAHVEAGMGSEEACRTHLERALTLARSREVGSIETLAGTAAGLLELGLGRYADAIRELEATGRTATACGLLEPGVSMWAADLAEAYARAGSHERARTTLAALEAQATAVGRVHALAAVHRVRGLLADEQDYEEHFGLALRLLDADLLPFELARTKLCLGERLRASGRSAQAREALRPALQEFERLAAAPWAERARRELAAAGERPASGATGPLAELTPQELQVALVVSEGASNREAAAALFISPKTVEVHLTRIYRKLGVRSRTQLSREMRRHLGPQVDRRG